MTHLPISSHKPQPAGNTAGTMPASIATDSLATDTQSAGPFAFLLARQIAVTDFSSLDTIAIDGNAAGGSADLPLKDTQDQAASDANAPGDPAGIAAILMQLSVPEDRSRLNAQSTEPSVTLNGLQKADSMQEIRPLAPNSPQKTDSSQAISSSFPEAGRSAAVANLAGDQIKQEPAIDPLSWETAIHTELPAGPNQPTPGTTQTIVSQPGYVAMPGTPTGNMPSAATMPIMATPLGHNGWADEFSQKISWIGTQQHQVAELHLNPPNLGPLEVVLKISDNQATALFASPHGAVRDAVENALPKLREILADNGIMLGNTTISDQSPRDRGTDGFMGQGFGAAARHEIDDTVSGPAGSTAAAVQNASVRRHNGMVDTFA